MDISIVSGTYNRISYLKKMVQSVRQSLASIYGLKYEIVLVDGFSEDGTQGWCSSQPDIRLIQHLELLGAVKAFNDGAYAATGQYIILANDDIEFLDNSIWLAYTYMLNHPNCGIGCFNQDRRRQHMPDNHKDKYGVEYMPVVVNGKQQSWPYGQICIVPKWLGDKVGWWCAPNAFPKEPLHTYGGDNELSSQVYNLGFKISPVPGTKIHDGEADDQLRIDNNIGGSKSPQAVRGYHPDSAKWGDKWHDTRKNLTGPIIKDGPTISIPSMDIRMKILYLPIFEPGWDVLKEQKRGLREALARVGIVHEYDYMQQHNGIGKSQMMAEIMRICQEFNPSLIVTQLHNPDMINGGDIHSLRNAMLQTIFANWNGDYWPEQQLKPEALELARSFDLNTTVNREVIEKHQAQGINTQFWQIGWEPLGRGFEPEIYHDVVFLASGYSPKRQKLGQQLKSFRNITFGLYGPGWPDGWAKGSNLYNFQEACKIYRGGKIAIGDSQWPESGFVSNRVMQVLAAGNCVLCHQWFKDMDQLGLIDGETCIIWRDIKELEKKLVYYLDEDNGPERQKIAIAGELLALERHSFDVRVNELFTMLGIGTEIVMGNNWR